MSGSILASFSLAFWRIRAADSWCEMVADDCGTWDSTSDNNTKKKNYASHLSVITVIWQGWNRLNYQLAYTVSGTVQAGPESRTHKNARLMSQTEFNIPTQMSDVTKLKGDN